MVLKHDFKRFPELTNSQMQVHYFDSPHRQILEPIQARVVKVTDGDTIRVEWSERDFDFPVRMADIAAAELDEQGGQQSQSWLEKRILGEEVTIIPTKGRVEKWGRLLANVLLLGMDMSAQSIDAGHATKWKGREVSPWS